MRGAKGACQFFSLWSVCEETSDILSVALHFANNTAYSQTGDEVCLASTDLNPRQQATHGVAEGSTSLVDGILDLIGWVIR